MPKSAKLSEAFTVIGENEGSVGGRWNNGGSSATESI